MTETAAAALRSQFSGLVAVVSGGASGIGAAVVARMRAGGATVEVADLDPRTPPSVNLADAAQVQGFVEAVVEKHARCDVLVNCAGVIAVGTAVDCTEEEWDHVHSVNVRGAWLLSKYLIPRMPSGSAIVNVSSGAGVRAISNMAAYVASKHAIVGLTRAMAIDHAPQGIRVNCVCPGVVDTPLAESAQERRPVEIRDAVACHDDRLIKRNGDPDEVAEAICFLGSPAASLITGATLAVDGGRTMH